MSPTPQRRLARRLSRHLARRFARRFVALAACAVVAAPAWLQAATPPATPTVLPAAAAADKGAEAAYQEARAVCLSGSSQQDRATCLKEAGAVRAERRSGRADKSESVTTLQANALKRCEVQPPQQRSECERLARGEGSQVGTVKGGGVIKEIVTQVPEVETPGAAKR